MSFLLPELRYAVPTCHLIRLYKSGKEPQRDSEEDEDVEEEQDEEEEEEDDDEEEELEEEQAERKHSTKRAGDADVSKPSAAPWTLDTMQLFTSFFPRHKERLMQFFNQFVDLSAQPASSAVLSDTPHNLPTPDDGRFSSVWLSITGFNLRNAANPSVTFDRTTLLTIQNYTAVLDDALSALSRADTHLVSVRTRLPSCLPACVSSSVLSCAPLSFTVEVSSRYPCEYRVSQISIAPHSSVSNKTVPLAWLQYLYTPHHAPNGVTASTSSESITQPSKPLGHVRSFSSNSLPMPLQTPFAAEAKILQLDRSAMAPLVHIAKRIASLCLPSLSSVSSNASSGDVLSLLQVLIPSVAHIACSSIHSLNLSRAIHEVCESVYSPIAMARVQVDVMFDYRNCPGSSSLSVSVGNTDPTVPAFAPTMSHNEVGDLRLIPLSSSAESGIIAADAMGCPAAMQVVGVKVLRSMGVQDLPKGSELLTVLRRVICDDLDANHFEVIAALEAQAEAYSMATALSSLRPVRPSTSLQNVFDTSIPVSTPETNATDPAPKMVTEATISDLETQLSFTAVCETFLPCINMLIAFLRLQSELDVEEEQDKNSELTDQAEIPLKLLVTPHTQAQESEAVTASPPSSSSSLSSSLVSDLSAPPSSSESGWPMADFDLDLEIEQARKLAQSFNTESSSSSFALSSASASAFATLPSSSVSSPSVSSAVSFSLPASPSPPTAFRSLRGQAPRGSINLSYIVNIINTVQGNSFRHRRSSATTLVPPIPPPPFLLLKQQRAILVLADVLWRFKVQLMMASSRGDAAQQTKLADIRGFDLQGLLQAVSNKVATQEKIR